MRPQVYSQQATTRVMAVAHAPGQPSRATATKHPSRCRPRQLPAAPSPPRFITVAIKRQGIARYLSNSTVVILPPLADAPRPASPQCKTPVLPWTARLRSPLPAPILPFTCSHSPLHQLQSSLACKTPPRRHTTHPPSAPQHHCTPRSSSFPHAPRVLPGVQRGSLGVKKGMLQRLVGRDAPLWVQYQAVLEEVAESVQVLLLRRRHAGGRVFEPRAEGPRRLDNHGFGDFLRRALAQLVRSMILSSAGLCPPRRWRCGRREMTRQNSRYEQMGQKLKKLIKRSRQTRNQSQKPANKNQTTTVDSQDSRQTRQALAGQKSDRQNSARPEIKQDKSPGLEIKTKAGRQDSRQNNRQTRIRQNRQTRN